MKRKYKFVIDIPEVEAEAYDHDRPISGLVHHQLIHLSAAEQSLPPEKRTKVNISTLHTEREAAAYIKQVTARLHLPLPGKKRKRTKPSNMAKTASRRSGSKKRQE